MPIDFAKSQAVSIASSKLQKVAGNLPGLLGLNKGKVKFNSSDTAFSEEKAQNSPNLFQFPLDVSGDPGIGNHGHYIIFFINEQQNSQLSFAGQVKDGKQGLVKEQQARDIPQYIKKNFGGQEGYRRQKNTEGLNQMVDIGTSGRITDNISSLGYGPAAADALANQNRETEGGQIVKVKRPPTRRLDTAIALYMPAQVQVTYGSKFNDTEISPFAAAAGEAFTDVMAGAGLSDTYDKVVGNLAEGFQKKAFLSTMSILDSLGVSGARESIEIASGEIIADRMELAFKGVDRRAFQYTFKMIPRNSREAEEIRKIVFAFKANMLPEMIKGRDRDTMNVPNTFNIQYMYRGKENDYLHRVSECFLENVQVTYGGDRYKTFEPHADDGAPPVETSITLAFKEIEIITRERIFEGY